MGHTGDLGYMVSFILPSASQKENMDRKGTQRSIVQIAIYIRRNKDGKKKIQRAVLQVLRYNLKRKDN